MRGAEVQAGKDVHAHSSGQATHFALGIRSEISKLQKWELVGSPNKETHPWKYEKNIYIRQTDSWKNSVSYPGHMGSRTRTEDVIKPGTKQPVKVSNLFPINQP